MKSTEKPMSSPTPFTSVSVNKPVDEGSPEQLEAQAAELTQKARIAREQAEKNRVAKLAQDKQLDLETLANLRKEVTKLEFVEKGTTDPEKRLALFEKIAKYRADIDEIETKYGMNIPAPVAMPEPEPHPTPTSSAVLITTLKIAALLLLCWGIVLYSGDWIVAKYPNAAIYNEVSFQKVMFGFSVFIGGFVSVIIALNVFFPGFGRYFNPFNHNSLDFFDDFKTLSAWQRNLIALGLFFCLLFAFVLIAGGKLD